MHPAGRRGKPRPIKCSSVYIAAMDKDGFWAIIAQADSPEDLHRRLAELSDTELADFEVHHEQAFADSYDWRLWGAAYVIGGGCGDDMFDYFRAYLIGRGRDVFEAALRDPDSLASVELDGDEEWEDWMSPSMYIAKARTGSYAYAAPERHPPRLPEPAGEEWEEDDLDELFPRLSEKYR
jgi:hypothetical protein